MINRVIVTLAIVGLAVGGAVYLFDLTENGSVVSSASLRVKQNAFVAEKVMAPIPSGDVYASIPGGQTLVPQKIAQFNEGNRLSSISKEAVLHEAQSAAKEYEKFLSQSRLSAEDQRRLMGLVAERSFLALERDRGLKGGRFKTADEANLFYKTESSVLDARMRDVLGDQYMSFQTASEQIPIQRLIYAFAGIVAAKDTPVPPTEQDRLVVIFYRAYKEDGVNPFYSVTYNIVSPQTLAREMKRRSVANEQAIKAAAEFLSESQLERLRIFQDQQVQGMLTRARLLPSSKQ